MPTRIKVIWVICCFFIFIGFLYFSMQRGFESERKRMEAARLKAEQIAKTEKEVKVFKAESFITSSSDIKEFMTLGKHEEAQKMAQEVIERDPKDSNVYTLWGISLVRTKKYFEAIQKFEKSAEIDRLNPKTFLYWGLTLAMEDKHDEAIQKYLYVIKLDPENSNAFAYWGTALLALGHTKDAIERLKQALGVNPNNTTAFEVMVEALYLSTQYEDAWEIVAKAREKNIHISEKVLERLKEAMPKPT